MGLRERKRARTHKELLEAAISLFRERGFEATPVRAVLERVEVSEATFFNYFPSKEALLAAWAAERLEACLAPALEARGGLRAGVRAGLRRLADALEAEPALARDAWGRLRVGAPERAAPWRAALGEAQQRGELRADLPADELAAVLAAAVDTAVAGWAARGAAAALAPRLQRAADLVLDGGRKRHERVRAPSPSHAAPRPHRV